MKRYSISLILIFLVSSSHTTMKADASMGEMVITSITTAIPLMFIYHYMDKWKREKLEEEYKERESNLEKEVVKLEQQKENLQKKLDECFSKKRAVRIPTH